MPVSSHHPQPAQVGVKTVAELCLSCCGTARCMPAAGSRTAKDAQHYQQRALGVPAAISANAMPTVEQDCDSTGLLIRSNLASPAPQVALRLARCHIVHRSAGQPPRVCVCTPTRPQPQGHDHLHNTGASAPPMSHLVRRLSPDISGSRGLCFTCWACFHGGRCRQMRISSPCSRILRGWRRRRSPGRPHAARELMEDAAGGPL